MADWSAAGAPDAALRPAAELEGAIFDGVPCPFNLEQRLSSIRLHHGIEIRLVPGWLRATRGLAFDTYEDLWRWSDGGALPVVEVAGDDQRRAVGNLCAYPVDERADLPLPPALEQAEGPILAYCRSGTRSTLLWALAAAKQGETPDAIARAAAQAGYDVGPIRPMIDMLAAR